MFSKRFSAPSFLLLLGIICLINLLTAGLVNISGDECYYWMYGNNLDWGYFDHPPMLALWIKMGYTIFPNTLGVRLFPVLASTASIAILYHLTKVLHESLSPKQAPLHLDFLSLFACCLLYQVYCFIATPDNPLLFFGSLFLLVYYYHLRQVTWLTSIALGILAAGLLYSKYHGILVLFFVGLSNLHLLRKPSTYIAAVIAFLLFMPHLYWQYSHDYPSLVYHLSERHSETYRFSFTSNYLLHQVLLFLPFIVFYGLKKRATKKENITENAPEHVQLFYRACRFMLIGIWAFFFLMSFKGKTQSHWTLVLCLPLLLLAVKWLRNTPSIRKPLYYTAAFFIGLSLLMRVFLLVEVIPNRVLHNHFFRGKAWATGIQQAAKESPVVFVNSYDKAARYSFYTQEVSHSLNNIYWRKNQYDHWNYDHLLHKDTVFMVSTHPIEGFALLDFDDPQKHYGKQYQNLRIYPNICLQFADTITHNILRYRELPLTISHSYAPSIILNESTFLEIYYYEGSKIIASTRDVKIMEWDKTKSSSFELKSDQEISLTLLFEPTEELQGTVNPKIGISIRSSDLGPIRHLCK